MDALLALTLLAAAASTTAIPHNSIITLLSSTEPTGVTKNAITAQEVDDWKTVLEVIKIESEKAAAKARLESLGKLLQPQFGVASFPSQQFGSSLLTSAQIPTIPQLSNQIGSQCLSGGVLCGSLPFPGFSGNFQQQNPKPTFVETDDWSTIVGQLTSSKDQGPSAPNDWMPSSNLDLQGWNFIPSGQKLFGGR